MSQASAVLAPTPRGYRREWLSRDIVRGLTEQGLVHDTVSGAYDAAVGAAGTQ